MKIKQLKINGFGKLANKQIEFKDGINVVYGENESGKSTLLKFISCMLYGTSRNKNGKSISDFDRFKPWKTEEYSGTIDYELDDGKEYSVYREFRRKNPTIYNNLKEDITKSFKETKNGVEFFEEQTGIDEALYFNTAISEQAEVALSLNNQNGLVQRISNTVSTGNESVSYQKWMAQLTKAQNENVGTDRTSLKPINIVNSKIEASSKKLKELEELRNMYSETNLNNEKYSYTLKNNEKKLSFLRRIKEFNEKNKIKIAEINFNKNALAEDDDRIEEIKEELEELKGNVEYKEVKAKPFIITLIAMAFIEAFLCILGILNVINLLWLILPATVAVIAIIIMIIARRNAKNSGSKANFSQKNKLKFELDTLKEKKWKKEKELKKKNEKLESEIDAERDALINEYIKAVDSSFIDEILEKSHDEILNQIDLYEKKVSEIKLDMKELEVNKKNYDSQMEELSRVEEELSVALEEREDLLSLNKSYNIAKDCLEKAYEQTKQNISPKFTNNLCGTINKISSGKYDEILLNDQEGLVVKVDNGSYVPIERLSIGTIDQMYLSLRLSALEEASTENMPIILDEAFAYFDNNRLENIISFIKQNYSNKQILIFTCSQREKEVLERLNIEYNLINLEK